MISTDYKVDFTKYAINFETLAGDRLLSQFNQTVVLKALIKAFADEAQELFDTIIELLKLRTIYDGRDYYLDAIGRIVGQPRENISLDLSSFFTPDEVGLGADKGLAWVTGGGGGTGVPADSDYKTQILGRILSNMNKTSSVPYLQYAIKAVLGLDVSFNQTDMMEVEIKAYRELSPFERGFLMLLHSANIAEKSYYLPYPATLKITGIDEEYVGGLEY